MAARTELEIVWDGPVKGLEAKRVSLTHFGQALDLLMKAARRIASQKLTNALEDTKVGRLAAASQNLDIEIDGIKKASSGLSTVITFDIADATQSVLFNQLPELVGLELLDAIEAESRGIHRNTAVRTYLGALPRSLSRQEYNLYENGRSVRRVEIAHLDLPEVPEPLPMLVQVNGRITGVGFDPGKWEVKVKGSEQVVAIASEEQVNTALNLRAEEVRTLSVRDAESTRLLVIELNDNRYRRPSLEDIFDKWDATFKALA